MDLLPQDYLNGPEFQSNSPSSAQLNASPQQSPFDSFEFSQPNHFPHTPSYNGSYQNSPYSVHSELSFDVSDSLLFDDQLPEHRLREDYDPAEYDGPNATSTLLMFPTNTDYLSGADAQADIPVSVVPAHIDQRSAHNFDYSPPSSNGCDSGGEVEARSRASSISSNQHISSPRVDVAQSFEKMGIRTPIWATSPLPHGDQSISPPQKPQSPPTLMIPDMTSPTPTFAPLPPTINAPAGDGGLIASGPQLHIVPATPITGGAGATTPTPYQQGLETLQQDLDHESQLQPTPQGWNPHTQQMSHREDPGMVVPQFRESTQPAFNFPSHSHEALSNSNAQIHPSQNHQQQRTNTDFLYPLASAPRMRSKSETSLHPPHWNTPPFLDSTDQIPHDDSALDDESANTMLNDYLVPTTNDQLQIDPRSQQQPSLGQMGPHLSQNFAFGSPPSLSQLQSSHNYLSPDFIRKSKSESGRPGHRQSRSEDMRYSSNPLLYPPPSQSTQDLIDRQYLHPSESVQPIRGHFRRASSGARIEHPGTWSSSSSQRPSPYPSRSVSPRAPYEELPNVNVNAPAPTLPKELLVQEHTIVAKPTVTTGRTANASHKRRKQEANFVCPVPGCGSTFTRSFNLKGHLRSHNEEKPFQCKWPGCGKGFARQHDCKRHEQLHSNYRPFICEGCNKPFARMDALNRHLRSEGGAECFKMLNDPGREAVNGRAPKGFPDPASMKPDPDSMPDPLDLSRMSVML